MPKRKPVPTERGAVTELRRHWIQNSLELRLRRSKGERLQEFLALVMSRIHGDGFVEVGTDQALGDLKCDGLLRDPLSIFACYGPVDGGVGTTRSTISKVAQKVRDDFNGAAEHWPEMKKWTFVTNYIKLPAKIAKEIFNLQKENQNIEISLLELRAFHELISALPIEDIEGLLWDDVTLPHSARASTAMAIRPLAGHFVGRKRELDRLVTGVTGSPGGCAFVVLGGPGFGKTTVTRQLASRPEIVERFDGRRWFVPLERARTRNEFEAAVARSVGGDDFRDAVALCVGRPALLILDNLETPWEAAREATEAVLADLLGAGFTLVASMRGLDRPGGVAWVPVRLPPLEAAASRELFLGIADQISVGDRHLPCLLEKLAGIPLAIELVAHQAMPFTRAGPILEQWERVGTAMARRGDGSRDRLSSLDVSIELSVTSRRLTSAGRRMLHLLAELPAGAAFEDLSALVRGDAYAAVRGCLVTGLAFEREDRVGLLPPIRDYVSRRESGAPSCDDWIALYAGFVATEASPMSAGEPRPREIRQDAPNVVHAVRTALERKADVLGTVSPGRLVDLLLSSGEHAPGLLEGMVEAHADAGNDEASLRARLALGRLRAAQSDFPGARTIFLEAIESAEFMDLPRERAEGLLGLAGALRPSDTVCARRSFRLAYAAFRGLGCKRGRARALSGLGTCSLEIGRRASAARAYRRARDAFRAAGDAAGEARSDWSLAQVGLLEGDHAAAEKKFRSALGLFDQIGDTRGRANTMRGLGRCAILSARHHAERQRHGEARGDFRSAYGFLRDAQRTFRRGASALGISECIRSRADIMLDIGRHGPAAAAYRKALAIDSAVGSHRGQGFCHLGLSDVAFAMSDLGLAREHVDRAVAFFVEGRVSDGLAAADERRSRLDREA